MCVLVNGKSYATDFRFLKKPNGADDRPVFLSIICLSNAQPT